MVSFSKGNSPQYLLSALSGEPIGDIGPLIHFPLTANPAGFHHLLLAECALRQIPSVQQVVFILSNGKHPDPMKKRKIPEGEIRLSLLRQALQGFANPEESYPARMALQDDNPLRLKQQAWDISTVEFRWKRPVRLAEHVQRMRKKPSTFWGMHGSEHPDSSLEHQLRIPILVGTDLLYRMLDVRIFTEADLKTIAEGCLLLAVPRGGRNLSEILVELQTLRGVTLPVGVLDPCWLPEKLRVLLNLSSTIIRRAVQAGQALIGFMPQSASDLILNQKIYVSGVDEKSANEWQLHCHHLELKLEHCAKRLLELLDQLQKQGMEHTISLIESGTGGRIAVALTSVPGASRHLKQVLVPYSWEAQCELLGPEVKSHSKVSPERAEALAREFQARTGSDWVLAETGMAGPLSPERHSRKNGLCHVTLVRKPNVKKEVKVCSMKIECNPFFSKKEHQLLFAVRALQWFLEQLINSQESKK